MSSASDAYDCLARRTQLCDQLRRHTIRLRHLQRALVQPVARLTESPRDRQQRQRHARDADREQRLAAQAIDEPDRDDRHADVDQADEHGLAERVADAAAGLREDRRQVVEDRVDAGDLLEERQAERDQHDEADAPVEQAAQAARHVLRCEALRGSAAELSCACCGAADARQHVQRLLVAALHQQPARAFRNERQQQQIQQRRKHLHAEHPAPVVLAHAEQEVVGEERRRDADHDHELVERHEPAAPPRGRDLRDVDRRDQNRRADREPADDARGYESREASSRATPAAPTARTAGRRTAAPFCVRSDR